jgi:hypothetical protein
MVQALETITRIKTSYHAGRQMENIDCDTTVTFVVPREKQSTLITHQIIATWKEISLR